MENELIEVQEQALSPINQDTLITLAEQAEKRIDAMNKIKKVALKLTNSHDWVDQGGKPYLQVSGAEKIGRMFGVSWRIDEPIFESEEGGHYTYTYKGYFSLAGATIEAIGTRSSKDGFFKKYGYTNGHKEELPPSAIDRGDVKKAAYTNLLGSGITRLLGIRNLTYDDLKEYAGITKDALDKVDYKKDGKTDTGIKSEGANTATVSISDIRKKTGEKNGKSWTSYIIKNGNAEYKTFSESFANVAKDAMGAGMQVEITYKQSQYGNDIEAIRLIEPPAEERNPGEEG